MRIKKSIYLKLKNDFGIELKNCIFLGYGHSGHAFLLPNGKVIKIFKDEEKCVHECFLLNSVRGNKHFPIVYECLGKFMIRQYVPGINLIDYIKKYGLSQRLAINLIELFLDFKRLGFTRLDMRCAHIFVQEDESIMVIDPRKHYSKKVSYPKSVLTKLNKLHVTDKFFEVLLNIYPEIYYEWIHKKAA